MRIKQIIHAVSSLLNTSWKQDVIGRPTITLTAQAQAAVGQTAAAAAAVAAVVATEARWDCSILTQDTQGYTPSELDSEIKASRLLSNQEVFPVSEAGVPRPAGDVVRGWRAALDYAHQLAQGMAALTNCDHASKGSAIAA